MAFGIDAKCKSLKQEVEALLGDLRENSNHPTKVAKLEYKIDELCKAYEDVNSRKQTLLDEGREDGSDYPT